MNGVQSGMVSFIIATFNGEKYLEETVRSALNQLNVDVEIIIIDDGSSDNSFLVAQELMKADERIVSLKNDRNLGFCRTVNKGIGIAKGSHIVILDQDDLLDKRHCESNLKLFDSETSLVFNDYYLIDGNGKIFDTGRHCLHREIHTEDFITGNKIPVPGLMIDKERLLLVGGYPELIDFPNYGEYHTWIRMSEVGKIKFNAGSIAFYRRHDTNMTNSFTDVSTIKKLARYSCVCKKQLLKAKRLTLRDKSRVLISLMKDCKKIVFA